jgi:hypothetical protein
MEEQTQVSTEIEELTTNMKEYVNTRYELLILKSADKFSVVVSEVASRVVIGALIATGIIVLSIAAALYLSALIGTSYSGFLIVGGFYAIAGIITGLYRKQLLAKPFRNKIVQKMFEED